MSLLLLADADFVIQDADTIVRDTSVLIENSVIKAVGPRTALPLCADAAETIGCQGVMLMPGLVNAHTHLFQVLTRGIGKDMAVRDWAREVTYLCARSLSRDEYFDAVLLACADGIRNGTTAVVDHPTHYARLHADESVRAIQESGLRGAVVRGGSDVSLVDPNEVRPLENELAQTAEFVERWGRSGRVHAWVGPSGFHTCSAGAFTRFKRLAEGLGARFHFHLAESALGRREAQAAGFPGEASHAYALGLLDETTSVAHAIWLDDEDIGVVARCGCKVVHCATSNQILASGIAQVPSMLQRGVTIALGTDGASSNDSQDLVAELKAAALIHRASRLDATVIGAHDVFRAATQGGAQVLGVPQLGRLVEGYVADIVGLRLAGNPCLAPINDPLATVVFQASGRDVCLTIVDGRVLYWNGAFTTIDVDALITRVTRAREAKAHRVQR